jgi:hypothetical protein
VWTKVGVSRRGPGIPLKWTVRSVEWWAGVKVTSIRPTSTRHTHSPPPLGFSRSWVHSSPHSPPTRARTRARARARARLRSFMHFVSEWITVSLRSPLPTSVPPPAPFSSPYHHPHPRPIVVFALASPAHPQQLGASGAWSSLATTSGGWDGEADGRGSPNCVTGVGVSDHDNAEQVGATTAMDTEAPREVRG